MAPIYSKQNVYFRSDRSVTQMMLENVSNIAPDKVISEDLLTKKKLTYGGLREDSFKAANTFRERYGIQPGAVVTVMSRSCVDYIVAVHSIWAAGGTVSSAEETSHAIDIVKPALFIVDAVVKEKLDKAIQLSHATYKDTQILTLLTRLPGHSLFPEDAVANAKRIPPDAYVLDGQDAHKSCAAIVLSSGTTGNPKAARKLERNGQGDFFSVSHIYGLTYCKLMQDKQATLARLLPTVAQTLAMSDVVTEYSYPCLEYFSCAGAVLKPTTAANFRKKFPAVSLCQTYGCTELSSCVSQSGTRDVDAPLVATGTILPNIGLLFVDENLKEVPAGELGEICVTTPTMMMGYKDNEEETQESMLAPGWYRTGDIGYLDADGYLIVVDRIKDIIKYKGFQVSPTELEEIIGTHNEVQDVGVGSVYYEAEATDVPRAYVRPISSFQPGELQRLANEIESLVSSKVAGYKKLRGGVKFVDSLPKNPTGKLLRRLFKDLEKAPPRARL